MMDANYTHCSNHFTIYISQTTMLSALNSYSDACIPVTSQQNLKKTLAVSLPYAPSPHFLSQCGVYMLSGYPQAWAVGLVNGSAGARATPTL